MHVHRLQPPAQLLSVLLQHFLLLRIIVPLSFGAMCAGFRSQHKGILPDTWRNIPHKRNLNAVFAQKHFTAKITYIDIKEYMDNRAIPLFDDLLLLMLKELHPEVKELEERELLFQQLDLVELRRPPLLPVNA